jgi:hypothetical protein
MRQAAAHPFEQAGGLAAETGAIVDRDGTQAADEFGRGVRGEILAERLAHREAAGDGEVALLTAAARAPGMRQAAALEGLGVSRRPDAALAIAAVLDGATDAAVVTGAARGLAEAGSTWAQVAAHRTAPLPQRCVEALLRAFVRGAADHEVMVAIAAVATRDTLPLFDAALADADATARPRVARLSRIVRRGLAR